MFHQRMLQEITLWNLLLHLAQRYSWCPMGDLSASPILNFRQIFFFFKDKMKLKKKGSDSLGNLHICSLHDENHGTGSDFSSVQSLSCVWPCDPMNRSTPGLPVHHQLPEFTQTHVHWVGDAIQLSHPLSPPSPPAPNPSWHQSLFQWVNSLHEVAKVLEFQL